MSMCYLCDLCAKMYPTADNDQRFGYCDVRNDGIFMLERKLAIDWGRDDPNERCQKFKPREEE